MSLLPYNPYRKQLALMALSTWVVLFGCLMIVPPSFVKDVVWQSSYLPFFVLIILSLFWSIWSITGRWKRSGLWSIIATVGLWLKINQLDSPWNILLLLGFGGVWEYYWNLATDPSISTE